MSVECVGPSEGSSCLYASRSCPGTVGWLTLVDKSLICRSKSESSRSRPDTSLALPSSLNSVVSAPNAWLRARFAAAVTGDKLGLGKLASRCDPLRRADGAGRGSASKFVYSEVAGSRSSSSNGGVATAPVGNAPARGCRVIASPSRGPPSVLDDVAELVAVANEALPLPKDLRVSAFVMSSSLLFLGRLPIALGASIRE